MPIHDWTRVSDGDFHDFHQSWSVGIRTALNEGLLPPDYYAQVEKAASRYAIPDVLTLSRKKLDEDDVEDAGGIAVKQTPPKVSMTATAERSIYLSRKNRVVIRKVGQDDVIAYIEIVSPGHKHNLKKLEKFVDKAVAALEAGIHLLIIDVLPPTKRDPEGVHSEIWQEVDGHKVPLDPQKPLTLAAYVSDEEITSYVEKVAVGMVLPDMPLFLNEVRYVNVPLEATYMEAYRGVPRQIKEKLE